MALVVYNTLTRTKELFEPLDPAMIRFYRCGPTVYNHAHIGHAKSYISFDVVRRYLMHMYGSDKLLYVMNITDVGHLANDSDDGDDKVEEQARQEKRSPFEIAAEYEQSFMEDLDKLNVLRPDRLPHATDFIKQQIVMIENLIDKGLAYEINGSVYFDIPEYERRGVPHGQIPYGGLSNRNTQDQQHGGRVEVNHEKRSPHDFAIWKQADEQHFMQWLSPWGWGYPGWHIECSAMAKFYLGDSFDIHAGGLDNMFPHHECEIAQSQAANDAPFVKYWMHNNFLNFTGQKMGKSLGNATNLKEMFKEYHPMALRFWIVQSHYRSELEFDTTAIAAAAAGYDRLRKSMERLQQVVTESGNAQPMPDAEELMCMTKFQEAMDDDFNTPVALGALFEGVSEVNKLMADGDGDPATLASYLTLFRTAFDQILGLNLLSGNHQAQTGDLTNYLMDVLIGIRKDARARKDFATSDAIRDRLKELGVVLEDGKDGTRWMLE